MYTHWHVAMNDDIIIIKQLDEMKEEHRKLDEQLKSMEGWDDELAIARAKKRKLQLRDMITTLEYEIYPDQPA
jgi:hypothetical protein